MMQSSTMEDSRWRAFRKQPSVISRPEWGYRFRFWELRIIARANRIAGSEPIANCRFLSFDILGTGQGDSRFALSARLTCCSDTLLPTRMQRAA
jgi:hypothetical protein